MSKEMFQCSNTKLQMIHQKYVCHSSLQTLCPFCAYLYSSMAILGRMETLCSSEGIPSRMLVRWFGGRFLLKRLKFLVSNARGTMNSFCVISLSKSTTKHFTLSNTVQFPYNAFLHKNESKSNIK